MKTKKIIITFFMIVCLLSLNINVSSAMNDNVPEFIVEYVTNIFNNNEDYDVIDNKGESVKNSFVIENENYYRDKNFKAIYSQIADNELILVKSSISTISTRASSTKNLTKTYNHTVRFTAEKAATFAVECYTTIRINESTGVITSFSGPRVSLKDPAGGAAVSESLYDVSTSYTWGSSAHRSIDFTYKYGYERIEAGSYGMASTYRSPYYTQTIHGE